jgi:uncharacterized protein (DUF488 family)
MTSHTAIPVCTIGYQGATVPAVLQALGDANVELLVDVRAVACSRRPGFANTSLAANVETIGVEYLHLRGLGTPADGRAAARSGKHAEMRKIFLAHLATDAAQAELETLADLVRGKRRVCLLCFEADAEFCHRSIVANALAKKVRVEIVHLTPHSDDADSE